jgi:hypothetical protein
VVFDGVASNEYVLIDDFSFAPIPEPATTGLVFLGFGGGGAAVCIRRRR